MTAVALATAVVGMAAVANMATVVHVTTVVDMAGAAGVQVGVSAVLAVQIALAVTAVVDVDVTAVGVSAVVVTAALAVTTVLDMSVVTAVFDVSTPADLSAVVGGPIVLIVGILAAVDIPDYMVGKFEDADLAFLLEFHISDIFFVRHSLVPYKDNGYYEAQHLAVLYFEYDLAAVAGPASFEILLPSALKVEPLIVSDS